MKLPLSARVVIFIRTKWVYLIPFVAYALIFLLPIPSGLAQRIRQGFGIEFVLLIAILVWMFSALKSLDWIPQTLFFILFGLALTSLWTAPLSEGQVIGGSLFFSDASRYYTDALRLLHGFASTNFSGRHPLPTLLLTSLLFLTGQNLKLALALLTVVAALTAWLAVIAVWRKWGSLAGAVFAVLLFLFYRPFIGVADSENLGLIFGCLGFALLLKDDNTRALWNIWPGLFVLSLGLTARPGPFLVLPALLVWRWKKDSAPTSSRLKQLLTGILVIACAFLLNFGVAKMTTAKEEAHLFSNYATTFYGLTHGGVGWEQYLVDHPESLQKTEIAQEQEAFQLGLTVLLQTPLLTVKGEFLSYRDFFSLQPTSAFGFLGDDPSTPANWSFAYLREFGAFLFRPLAVLLALVGLFSLWRRRREPAAGLIFWGFMGILVSVLFLPPIDSGRMRVYAAAIPFIVILPALGLAQMIKTPPLNESLPNQNRFSIDLILSGVLITAIVVFAIGFAASKKSFAEFAGDCLPGQSAQAILSIHAGSYLRLEDDTNITASTISNSRYGDFQASYASFPQTAVITPLNGIPANTLVMNSINLTDGQQLWGILPLSAEKFDGRRIEVCGNWDPEFLNIGLGFINVETIRTFPIDQ